MFGWHFTSYRSANFGIGLLYEPRMYAGLVKFTMQFGPWSLIAYHQYRKWTQADLEHMQKIAMSILRAANSGRLQKPPI